jgi:hypothetical protein
MTAASPSVSRSGLRLGAIALCLLTLGACTGMNDTQQRVVTGAAIGAAAGTVGTVVTGGCIACGAVVGTAVGAGAGYVVDQIEKDKGR